MVGAVIHVRYQDHPREYIDKLRVECLSVGVNTLIIVDETGFNMTRGYKEPYGFNYIVYNTIEEVEEDFKDFNKVYIEQILDEENPSVSLLEFEHPQEDIIYIVGSNPSGLEYKHGEKNYWVHLPVTNGEGVFYAETALIITLFNRMCNN